MYKPFIELFRTPNRNYFYEPNKNEFVEITDESFRYLQYVFNEDADLHEMPDEVRQLMKMGYLAEKSVVEKVEHPYTKYIKTMLGRKVSKITLQLTQKCNFRCKYCIYSESANEHQRTHSAKEMSWETAKKCIDFLWEHSVDSRSVNVGFYGGEPLIEFPLIKKTVLYSKEKFKGKKLTFSITSNGTLLTEEIIHFFALHDINLMISLDGPKEINDLNRVFANGEGTFDAVMEKIKLIKKLEPEYIKNVRFSMVIDPKNDFDCINSIYLDTDTIEKWSISSTLIDTTYDEAQLDFSEDYTSKYQYHKFLAILENFKRISDKNTSPMLQTAMQTLNHDYVTDTLSKGLFSEDAPGGPCIPGQLRLFSDVDGNLFPCERVSEKSEIMHIGNIDTGFNFENIVKILNVGNLTAEMCKKCWCFKNCSICARFADDGSGNLSAAKKEQACFETRQLVYEKFYDYLVMKEIPDIYNLQLRSEEKEAVRL